MNYILFSLIEMFKALIKNLLRFFPQLSQIPACLLQSVLNIEKQSNSATALVINDLLVFFILISPCFLSQLFISVLKIAVIGNKSEQTSFIRFCCRHTPRGVAGKN